jgi:hypothetical protein
MKEPGSDEFAQPLLPKPRPADRRVESEAKESALPSLESWQRTLDDHAALKAKGDALPTLDFKLHDAIVRHLSETIRWRTWPQDLYVPAGADWKQYWISPCPPDHRFTHGWTGGPGSDANVANPVDGHLFAFAAARISDAHLHSEAGVGFYFTPTPKLAVYKIQPGLSALGQYRWDTGIAQDFGGWIRLRGFLYTCAWSVSPYDGSLSLVTPYGLATAFDQSYNNQGGIPITAVTPWPPGPPAANIMLEGGRKYLIGIVAAVQIDNTWTDSQGHTIPSLPPDAIWKVWCSMDCNVSSVSIDASTIYIP